MKNNTSINAIFLKKKDIFNSLSIITKRFIIEKEIKMM